MQHAAVADVRGVVGHERDVDCPAGGSSPRPAPAAGRRVEAVGVAVGRADPDQPVAHQRADAGVRERNAPALRAGRDVERVEAAAEVGREHDSVGRPGRPGEADPAGRRPACCSGPGVERVQTVRVAHDDRAGDHDRREVSRLAEALLPGDGRLADWSRSRVDGRPLGIGSVERHIADWRQCRGWAHDRAGG